MNLTGSFACIIGALLVTQPGAVFGVNDTVSSISVIGSCMVRHPFTPCYIMVSENSQLIILSQSGQVHLKASTIVHYLNNLFRHC